jgi:formylglycine-generating enzyme required for sulfatase activity
VVVALADGRFHEVERVVPFPKQVGNWPTPAVSWEELPDGTVDFAAIKVPPLDVTSGMTLFAGGKFEMGVADDDAFPLHPETVPAFYLDPSEVSVGAYKRVIGSLPTELIKAQVADSFPITRVSFFQAQRYAEMVCKRLPDEVEYEFAATQGGTRRFPWGDSDPKSKDWPVGKVGEPPWDKTPTNPPVFGLYSNAVEWTSSRHTQYAGVAADQVERFYSPEVFDHFGFAGARIVRGGPSAVANRDVALWENLKKRNVPDYRLGPRYRFSYPPQEEKPGLGFRCARSAKPRFLDP